MGKIYKNYADSIQESLTKGKRRGSFNKSFDSYSGISGIPDELKLSINEARDTALFNSLQPLTDIVGKKVKYHERPGAHPDFLHIKQSDSV